MSSFSLVINILIIIITIIIIKNRSVHKHLCTDSNTKDDFLKLYTKAHNHSEQGNYAKAEALLLKLWKLGREQNMTMNDMSNVYNDLSIAMMRQGKYKESEIQLRACLQQVKQGLGADSREYLNTTLNLANALNYQGYFIIFTILIIIINYYSKKKRKIF